MRKINWLLLQFFIRFGNVTLNVLDFNVEYENSRELKVLCDSYTVVDMEFKDSCWQVSELFPPLSSYKKQPRLSCGHSPDGGSACRRIQVREVIEAVRGRVLNCNLNSRRRGSRGTGMSFTPQEQAGPTTLAPVSIYIGMFRSPVHARPAPRPK